MINRLSLDFESRPVWWTLTVGYLILITYLLLTPHPLMILGVWKDMPGVVEAKTVPDYAQHAIVYAVLTILLLRGSVRWRVCSVPFCMSFAVGHAAFCELLQHFVPNRFWDLRDLLANTVGLGLGLSLVRLWNRMSPWVKSFEQKSPKYLGEVTLNPQEGNPPPS